MSRRDASLLDQIEAEALSNTPIADTLRKVVALGGHSGSSALRDWANKELKGYETDDELPIYRKIGAAICVDAIIGNNWVKAQRISTLELPEFAQEHVSEELPMYQSIGHIEAMIRDVEARGESSTHLSLPSAAELARYMDAASGNPFQKINGIYWNVSVTALHSIVDQVRTALVELVAEMRAGTPAGQEVPTAAVADQAVNVAIHGDNSRVVITTQSSGGNSAIEGSSQSADGKTTATEDGGWWTPARKIGGVVVGLATIGGTVLAYLTFIR